MTFLNSNSNSLNEDKLYYSISEVAKLTGLEQHVIRYWESEFSKLRPRKNRSGNRQFRKKDIQIVRYIKHLLHHDMYTIQGAKKRLAESGYKEIEGQLNLLSAFPQASTISTPKNTKAVISKVLQELKEINELLKN